MVTGNLVGAKHGCGSRAWFHFSVGELVRAEQPKHLEAAGGEWQQDPKTKAPQEVVAVNQH